MWEQQKWVEKCEGLQVCRQLRQVPGIQKEEHSLGQQEMVQWIQPACWPFDWSSVACWQVELQTVGCKGAEDQTYSLLLECMAETLEASVVEHPLVVARSERLLAQTENSSGQPRQVALPTLGVLSYLAVDLVGKQSLDHYKVHSELDSQLACVRPHSQAGDSPDIQAEAAYKERPSEVAG